MTHDLEDAIPARPCTDRWGSRGTTPKPDALQCFVIGSSSGHRWQVSIAGYPETIREQLGIGDELRILCGLAVGYPDPDFPANSLRVPRNPLEDNVVFVES